MQKLIFQVFFNLKPRFQKFLYDRKKVRYNQLTALIVPAVNAFTHFASIGDCLPVNELPHF